MHALTAAADEKTREEFLADWRASLTSNFSLTDDQRRWLDSVDQERDAQVKAILRQTIESGGKYRLVVVMLADQAKPGGLFHELRHGSVDEQRHGLEEFRANLVIAHCDADCSNWGWGPG